MLTKPKAAQELNIGVVNINALRSIVCNPTGAQMCLMIDLTPDEAEVLLEKAIHAGEVQNFHVNERDDAGTVINWVAEMESAHKDFSEDEE